MSVIPHARRVLLSSLTLLLCASGCGPRATQPSSNAAPRGTPTTAPREARPGAEGASAATGASRVNTTSANSPSAGTTSAGNTSTRAVGAGAAIAAAPRATEATSADTIARQELARLVRETHVRRAAIVVLDAATGRILARAGVGPEGDALTLRAVETGSSLKTLTVAAALDAGLDPAQRFTGEGGTWKVGGVTVRDVSPSDWLDAQRTLVRSSNIGAAKLAERHLPAVLALQERLGWRTDLGLGAAPAEPPAPAWTGGQGLRLASGMGTRASPLHLASAYAALLLDGTFRPPTADGTGAPVRVVSQATAAKVRELLEAAVTEGTGKGAKVEGVRTAGKTGTTRSAEGGTWGQFIGIAPADAPRWVVSVSAEAPGEGYTGGSVAAPAFARVVRELHAASSAR